MMMSVAAPQLFDELQDSEFEQQVLGAQQVLSAQHFDFALQSLQMPLLHFPQHLPLHSLHSFFSQTGLFVVC